MDLFLLAQAEGYKWALQQERHSEYKDMGSYSTFYDKFIDDELADEPFNEATRMELWYYWEKGIKDANWVIPDDVKLSVSEVAEKAGVNRSYVKAEITAGRLPAQKYGRDYSIFPDDFRNWLNTPKRGSRSKTS